MGETAVAAIRAAESVARARQYRSEIDGISDRPAAISESVLLSGADEVAARGETTIGRPCLGLMVGIWRMVSRKSSGRESAKRERMSVAIVRISSWPKRMPMHVREPPPKGM